MGSNDTISLMPTSKLKYQQGKQVSRWDADSENVDIEYKNLDNSAAAKSTVFSGNKGCALRILLLLVCVAVGMILGYVIRRNIHEQLNQSGARLPEVTFIKIQQDFQDSLRQKLQDDLDDTTNYEDHLDQYTRNVMLSGMAAINKFIKYVSDMWQTFRGFDSIHRRSYNATLSYPNLTIANSVVIMGENSTLIFESHSNMTNVHPEYMPFNAYSPKGIVKGKLVYANYGTKEDFALLTNYSIDVKDKIVVIKYGKIHPASKIRHAAEYKAVGVIFYPDPVDFVNNQTNLPHATWWLPDWAVPRTHVRYCMVGDPSTPGYAAIDGVYHLHVSEADVCYPRIPSQPISYSDAKLLMQSMEGPIAPNKWFGGLNITYRLGPGYKDNREVTLTVLNENIRRDITNLIAVIEGRYEKDKYIIVGAHVDSWTKAAIGEGSGYAIIWELARAFTSRAQEDGWKPRRSILFALWDASKFGHIGSFEWVEEYKEQLLSGAVAYINLDTVIQGNYSFYAEASPLLQTVIKQAADQVPCTDPDYYDESVLRRWRQRFPDLHRRDEPRFYPLKADSDHSPFFYYLGVPSVSPAFTFDRKLYKNLASYPVYGTLADSREYLRTFIDPSLKLHQTVAKVVSNIVLRLADSAILPLDVGNYLSVLKEGEMELKPYESVFKAASINIDVLLSKIKQFKTAISNFCENVTNIEKEKLSEFDLYMFNHKLVQLPRVFVVEEGIQNQSQYRNILIAPHPEDLTTQQIFPGIKASLQVGLQSQNWTPMKKHISYLVIAFQQAVNILTDSILGKV